MVSTFQGIHLNRKLPTYYLGIHIIETFRMQKYHMIHLVSSLFMCISSLLKTLLMFHPHYYLSM